MLRPSLRMKKKLEHIPDGGGGGVGGGLQTPE